MSTQLGTLHRTRFAHLIWPAVVIALIVAVSVALVVTALGRDAAREDSTAGVREGSTNGVVSANTPSEMRAAFGYGGAIGGTLANTPSEIRAGSLQATAPERPFGRHNVTPRVGANEAAVDAPSVGGDTTAQYHPLP